MAEWDWDTFSSIASNVLPAAIGAMAGARRGGIGAVPGALYGVGSAARSNIESDLERQKLNTDIAFRNQTQELARQRIEQENRQLDLQSQNYNRLNRVADEQIKNYGLERQKHQMEIDAATRSVEGQKIFRESLPPEKQVIFDAAPNKQAFIQDDYKEKDWEAKTNSSAELLKRVGLDAETARMLGPTGTSHLIGSIMESKARPRDNFGFHYDPNSGYGFSYDKTTGKMTKEKLGDPKAATPEKRTAIENSLLKTWKEQNPPLARLGEETGDWSSYDEWRASDRGRIEAAYLSGDIDFKTAQGYRESLQRGEQQITAGAMDSLRRAYLGAGGSQTEQGFQQYLQTPQGKQNFDAYKRAERNKGRARSANPAEFLDSAAKDLEYAKQNNTSLEGRKNAKGDREPTQSELAYFKANPHVGGMAAEDNSVVMNPFSKLSAQESAAVRLNEQARIAMRTSGERPRFDLTAKQRRQFANYGSEQDIRETIVGRIVSGDPSALDVTAEQRAFADKIKQRVAPTAKGSANAKDSLLKDFGL